MQRNITWVVVATLALTAFECEQKQSSRSDGGPDFTTVGRRGPIRSNTSPPSDASSEAGAGSTRDAATDAGTAGSSTRIARENALPGTSAWKLDLPARKHEVEGYASAVSAVAGDHVQLKISVDQPQLVHYELYRMGYYQGLGGRFISSSPARKVEPQPACAISKKTALVECDWASAFDVEVQPSWLTGQYFFKLINESGVASYVSLVVREKAPSAPVVMQSSVTTWQAYNVFGGSSLYRNLLPPDFGWKPKRAYAVSFNRPYTCQDLNAPDCFPGSGDFDMGESWMIRWIEQKGVELAYVTNLDIESQGKDLLHGRSLFMTVGHDEYWTVAERDTLESARADGLNMAFVSANTGYWRIRTEAASSGEERRTIVCYKDPDRDPVTNSVDTTFEFREKPMPRPEESLIGVMYDDDVSRTYFDGFAQLVAAPSHWIYAGTGVKAQDVLSYVTGYEWDHAFEGPNAPAGREIVAHASAFSVYGQQLPADVTVYYPTANSFIFAAGSIYWARALSMPNYVDARIQRMFENVLVRAGITQIELTEPAAIMAPSASGQAITVVAGSGKEGNSDGAAMEAQFSAPVGLACAPDHTLYVSDPIQSNIRKISADGQVSTLAGCGHRGGTDGQGTVACFSRPTGLALASDGTLYVADTGSNLIRTISPTGEVKTVAGTGKAGADDMADPLQGTLNKPRGLAFTPDGTLLIADSGNNSVRKLDKSGLGTQITGSQQPTAVAMDADGAIYTVETRSGILRKYTQSGAVTVVGADGAFGDVNGEGSKARVRPADGMLIDKGAVVFTDSANHQLKVFRPDTNQVETLAGSGINASDLQMPRGVALTNDSYLVADTGNHRIIRIPRK